MISKISIHVKVKNIVKGGFLTPERFKIKQTSARKGEDYRSWEVPRVELLFSRDAGESLALCSTGNRCVFFLFSVSGQKGIGHALREQARSVMGPRDRMSGGLCHLFSL